MATDQRENLVSVLWRAWFPLASENPNCLRALYCNAGYAEKILPAAWPVMPAENAGKQKRNIGKGTENCRPAIVEGPRGDKGEKKDTGSVSMECLKASSHASEEIFVAVQYGGHSLAM